MPGVEPARAVPVRRRGLRPTRAMPAAHVSRVRALYRRILLLHRALPPDLKALGDQYVKDEFRRHKAVGPDEARRFLQEWEASGCPLGFATPWGPRRCPGRALPGRARPSRWFSRAVCISRRVSLPRLLAGADPVTSASALISPALRPAGAAGVRSGGHKTAHHRQVLRELASPPVPRAEQAPGNDSHHLYVFRLRGLFP